MSRPRRTALAMIALLAVVASGCRLEAVAEAVLEEDGTGSVDVVLALDPPLAAALAELGVEPAAELDAAMGAASDWRVSHEAADDGSLTVRLRRPTASPQDLADALASLSAGLRDDDPALVVDLSVDVDADGGSNVEGLVTLRPPRRPAAVVDGVAAGPDADRLAALAAAHVEATVALTLPGTVTTHDADHLDDRTLRWRLEPGEPRTLTATAAAPATDRGPVDPLVIAALVVAGVVLASVVATLLAVGMRRRRIRRAERWRVSRGG